jgi:antitoxin ParD1/3/4/toxin ParE1/3/4
MSDIREILAFIAKDNPRAASAAQVKLRDAMRRLARMPGLGHLREDLADEILRFFPVYSYLIVYRPDTRPLQVIRVLHAARDVSALLDHP